MDKLLLSIPEAVQTLGIGRSKLYEMIAEGDLETITIGRRRLIRAESVHALARAGCPSKAA